MLRLNAVHAQLPPFALNVSEVARPLLSGAGAELLPFGAGLVGGYESPKGAVAGGGRWLAGGEAVGRPPCGVGLAVGLIGRAGQLHAFGGALRPAERVVAEIAETRRFPLFLQI